MGFNIFKNNDELAFALFLILILLILSEDAID